jgi:aldose sugar dehydrogenase
MKYLLLIGGLIAFSLLWSCEKDDDDPPSDPVELRDSILVSGLSRPWEIIWGPDDFIWMTQRGGKISRVNPQTGEVKDLFTVPDVNAQGEGGLLGMALHPNFSATPHVFVAYNYGNPYREKIVRYTYNGTTLTSPQIIVDSIQAANIHNGCRLLIVDQKLFITTGDANNTALAQNATALNGKVLRVNLDGTTPSDNPTPGSRIWSVGHRNPQGLVFANGKLYSSEHGLSDNDEINIIEKGRNYGWPNVRGVCDGGEVNFCNTNNVREPIQTWTPTIAPSGTDYYDKDQIPQWKNSLLVAILKENRLMQLKLSSDGNAVDSVAEFFAGKYGRMRDVCISPDGKVYICTDEGSNAKIIEVKAK